VLDFGVIKHRVRTGANIALAVGKNVGSVLLDKAKAKAEEVKLKVDCYRHGHRYEFVGTDEYMGVGGKEPVYWRICSQCKQATVGKVVASPTTRKTWLAVRTDDKQEVEEIDLPDYESKTKARQ
jgi:hypothetical protein